MATAAEIDKTLLIEEYKRRKDKRTLDKIEELAYKWFDGAITAERGMEAVFGLINGEARR